MRALVLALVLGAAPVHAQTLYEQALALEREGSGAEAVKVHLQAARAGDGRSAMRLGEIYGRGIFGVAPNPSESARWYTAASQIAALHAAKASADWEAAPARIAAAERERERALADIAAARAAAERARAEAERAVAARRAASSDGVSYSMDVLFRQAQDLEEQGKGHEAVKVYVRAARAGSGKAAKRLGEIYDQGLAGVERNYTESLKWYNAARVLGEDVPLGKTR
jgi:hypothetical protein